MYMDVRVNIIIPKTLFEQSQQLVEKGIFSNFSELIRDGLRKEVKEYSDKEPGLSDDEKKLFNLLKEADRQGLLLTEAEMKKHGLNL